MTAVIRAAQLPGGQVDHRDSTANVKASAAFRMDENLSQFSVSGVALPCCAAVVCMQLLRVCCLSLRARGWAVYCGPSRQPWQPGLSPVGLKFNTP